MKKRQSSRNQSISPSSDSSSPSSHSSSPSPDIHHQHNHHHHHNEENIPFDECSSSKASPVVDNDNNGSNDMATEDPQPSTIAEADRVEKMQLAKLHDRKPRIRYDPPSCCPCCGRIQKGSRHIA